mgnify:FL=1
MSLKSILEFIRPAHKVPTTFWSAETPLTLKPKPITSLFLILGLWIFGTGDAFLIAAGVGNTPWTVLAEGIALKIDWSVGQATFLVSILVLFLWIPLREKPGIGTILNVILIAAAIEIMVPLLPTPTDDRLALLQAFGGVILIGIGSGLYLTANLGPGPRDGWMTGLQQKTGWPIARVRISIEITVLILGMALGGTFGWGTIMFAIGIGPVVAMCLGVASHWNK